MPTIPTIIYNVTSENGASSADLTGLNNVIAKIDGASTLGSPVDNYVINVTHQIDLTTDLLAINIANGSTVTIRGTTTGGHGGLVQTIDGEGDQRGFFVYSGNVTLQNLAINDAVAQGGAGGAGVNGGGGGGAGLGGGLFVAGDGEATGAASGGVFTGGGGGGAGASGGHVTLNNVTFSGDGAIGGSAGGVSAGDQNGGGGGGLGGAGGNGGQNGGGGGGGIGVGATGGGGNVAAGSGIVPETTRGRGGYNGAVGGPHGGGGGRGNFSGGGGGGGIDARTGGLDTGGAGGLGGGGGGGDFGGIGGFGGGGGGGVNSGGSGGFGGGGGGGQYDGGHGGAGGGAGEFSGGAGGGLGAGGDIFVQAGGSLTIEGGDLSSGTVTGGNGAGAGTIGGSAGKSIFLQGDGNVTLAAPVGQDLDVGEIGDVVGSGFITNGYTGGVSFVIIEGPGTVNFNAGNAYAGATVVASTGSGPGTLDLVPGGSIAQSDELELEGGSSFNIANVGSDQTVQVQNLVGVALSGQLPAVELGNNTLSVGENHATTFGGTIAGTGAVIETGTGVLTLGGDNLYSGGTTVEGGALSISAADNLGSGGLDLDAGTALELTGSTTLTAPIAISGDPIFDVAPGQADTVDTVIADGSGGAGTLALEGGGTLVLEDDNTYSGGTTIGGDSTLEIATGGAAGTGPITFDGGGTLRIDGTTMPSNTVIGLGLGDVFDLAGVAHVTAGSASLVGNELQISENGTNYDIQLNPGFSGYGFSVVGDGSGAFGGDGGTKVTLTADVGTEAQLNAALNAIDQGGADATPGASYSIALTQGIGLTTGLAAINLDSGASLTIDGNGYAINGGGSWAGFDAEAGTISIDNLVIADAIAQGGAGGPGQGYGLIDYPGGGGGGGGGGGAGLGGGLFVGGTIGGDAGADVTLDNVTFTTDAAKGGAGGGIVEISGGNGGTGGASRNANSRGGAGGSTGESGKPGGFGGGGGGGGGGDAYTDAGYGGYGGFGAGRGGGGYTTEFITGGPGGPGGGGLGAGGDIFVQQGGTLNIEGGSLSGGLAKGGAGGTGGYTAGSGEGLGGGIFIQGSQSINLDPLTGQTLTIDDPIADQGRDGGTAGVVIDGPGKVVFAADNTYTGGTTIDGGSTLEIGPAGAAGTGPITFAGSNATLRIDSPATGTLLGGDDIAGFQDSDLFDLTGIGHTSGATAQIVGSQLVVSDDGKSYALNLSTTGPYGGHTFAVIADAAGGINVAEDGVACYCRGMLILTEKGEVPIEEIALGDRVVTRSGEPKPVKWIGRRSYAGPFVAGNRDVMPICVKKGAFEDGIPARDLWVSPEHALYLDAVLVPARSLVNGMSIVQVEAVERVDYFHIELSRHDVIFAEGAPAETFVDDDSRMMFHNALDFYALYPDEGPLPALYCAPRVEDGFALETLCRRLMGRAARLGADGIAAPSRLRGRLSIASHRLIDGWAVDPDEPERPVTVVVLANGAEIGRVVADRYRPDLAAAGIGGGWHAFSLAIPGGLATAWQLNIEVYALPDWAPLDGSASLLQALAA